LKLDDLRPFAVAVASLVTAACAVTSSDEAPAAARPHDVFALDESGDLIKFNTGTPRKIDSRVRVTGLRPGESLVGIDFRVSRGQLYGLTDAGRLLRIDPGSGATTQVGTAAVPLAGRRFGFDFNPTVDRIRVVSDDALNLRLHPDTGAVVAADPALRASGGQTPSIAAAAYTYNQKDEKLTTNYAIDVARGWLVVQGSVEGQQPVVSPNTGLISDVGPLGTGPLEDAAFDIADRDNAAYAALRVGGRTRLYAIDLRAGKATLLGTVDRGQPLRGIAIEP